MIDSEYFRRVPWKAAYDAQRTRTHTGDLDEELLLQLGNQLLKGVGLQELTGVVVLDSPFKVFQATAMTMFRRRTLGEGGENVRDDPALVGMTSNRSWENALWERVPPTIASDIGRELQADARWVRRGMAGRVAVRGESAGMSSLVVKNVIPSGVVSGGLWTLRQVALYLAAKSSMSCAAYMQLCMHAHAWSMKSNTLFVSRYPKQILYDDRDRLHYEHGPAVTYLDGSHACAYHGIPMPADIFEIDITPNYIGRIQNQEVRTAVIRVYGLEKWLKDHEDSIRVLNEDEYGKLISIQGEMLPLAMVKNSSAEPDGSIKTYFLRAPRPEVRTCHEAIAATFGLPPAAYNPKIQT